MVFFDRLLLLSTKKMYSPVHFFAKLIILSILLPLVRIFFKLFVSFKIKLIPRHSLMDKNSYNIFFSDVDYDLIFDLYPKSYEINKANKLALLLNKIFKCLDYPEIYTEEEKKVLAFLNKHSFFSEIYLFVYNLRKITWEKNKIEKFKKGYHYLKSIRSIEKSINLILSKKVAINEYLAIDFNYSFLKMNPIFINHLPQVRANKIVGISNYIGCFINNRGSTSLYINYNELVLLMACIPEGENINSIDYKSLRNEDPKVREVYILFCIKELISCISVLRTMDNPRLKKIIDINIHKAQIVFLIEEINNYSSYISNPKIKESILALNKKYLSEL